MARKPEPCTAAAGSRNEKRRARTREAIIEAAAATFLRKGVADTTVAEITEAADIGYGSFYNHFQGVQDVVSAVAERTLMRVVAVTEAVLPDQGAQELVPAVSLRIIMRLMTVDPATRWLLERPYIFVAEWQKIITPSMEQYRQAGGAEVFAVLGGLATWSRMLPWLVISELNDAIEQGSSVRHEDVLANMGLHLLGVAPARRAALIDESKRVVDAALPAAARPPRSRRRPAPD